MHIFATGNNVSTHYPDVEDTRFATVGRMLKLSGPLFFAVAV